MIKKHKFLLIVTTLVTLLPILVGLLLWKQLPEQVPTHWNINGEVDGWSSRGFAVFGLPCILAALHWVCVLASNADYKRREYNPSMITLVLWICPGISLLICSLVYSMVLGHPLDVNIILPLVMGAMFLVIGNLLPKCRQSRTLGIKLPWTLKNEENWNKTHRFGGKVWVIGGIAIMATAFIGNFWILLAALILMMILPTVYSYCLHRKQQQKLK